MKLPTVLLLMLAMPFSLAMNPACFAVGDKQIVPRHGIPVAFQGSVTVIAQGLQVGDVEKISQDGKLISTKMQQSYPGQKLAKDAKVSVSDARAIALKAQPGQLADEELEKERGGSGLRYSFDIKASDGVHEVGIDAVTGAILENSVEGDNPD